MIISRRKEQGRVYDEKKPRETGSQVAGTVGIPWAGMSEMKFEGPLGPKQSGGSKTHFIPKKHLSFWGKCTWVTLEVWTLHSEKTLASAHSRQGMYKNLVLCVATGTLPTSRNSCDSFWLLWFFFRFHSHGSWLGSEEAKESLLCKGYCPAVVQLELG